jgi:hypothetical protein
MKTVTCVWNRYCAGAWGSRDNRGEAGLAARTSWQPAQPSASDPETEGRNYHSVCSYVRLLCRLTGPGAQVSEKLVDEVLLINPNAVEAPPAV